MKQKSLLKLLIVVLVLNGKKKQIKARTGSFIVAIKAGSAFVVLLSIISASAMLKVSC